MFSDQCHRCAHVIKEVSQMTEKIPSVTCAHLWHRSLNMRRFCTVIYWRVFCLPKTWYMYDLCTCSCATFVAKPSRTVASLWPLLFRDLKIQKMKTPTTVKMRNTKTSVCWHYVLRKSKSSKHQHQSRCVIQDMKIRNMKYKDKKYEEKLK